jgi:hypothetical protein
MSSVTCSQYLEPLNLLDPATTLLHDPPRETEPNTKTEPESELKSELKSEPESLTLEPEP